MNHENDMEDIENYLNEQFGLTVPVTLADDTRQYLLNIWRWIKMYPENDVKTTLYRNLCYKIQNISKEKPEEETGIAYLNSDEGCLIAELTIRNCTKDDSLVIEEMFSGELDITQRRYVVTYGIVQQLYDQTDDVNLFMWLDRLTSDLRMLEMLLSYTEGSGFE